MFSGAEPVDECEILETLEKKRMENAMEYEVTFSYGYVHIPEGVKSTLSDVLEQADTRMYTQKRAYHRRRK